MLPQHFAQTLKGIDEGLEAVLRAFGAYVIPVALAVATVLALLFLPSQYDFHEARVVGFASVEVERLLKPADALSELGGQDLQETRETRLSRKDFWVRPSLPSGVGAGVLEFTSRHAKSVTCWRANDLTLIGISSRSSPSRSIPVAKAGFALELTGALAEGGLVCRMQFEGPAKIKLLVWNSDDFERSVWDFHRASGLLEGGFLVLALFVFIVAIVNREWTYVIFAGWLVANLRLAALSSGWDTLWLEREIPPEYILSVRKLAIASYTALMVGLFSRLFVEELRQVRGKVLLRFVQFAAIPPLVAAVVLPYHVFLPYMWATIAFGAAGITILLVLLLAKTRSRVAAWYAGSLVLTMASGLAEVAAAALGLRQYIGSVNSVTGALAASLLAAIAIAEQLRAEREQRVSAQQQSMSVLNRFRQTYRMIPIGLFSVNGDGKFLHANPAFKRLLGLAANIDEHKLPCWSDHFPPEALSRLQESARNGSGQSIEIEGRTDGGDARWFQVEVSAMGDHLEGSLQDVTDRRRANDRLRFLANHDPLTGLLNRRGLEPLLEEALLQNGPASPASLAYIDLNRFKLVNDLYGHVAGDEVLRQVSRRLTGVLGDQFPVARIGGDEFIALIRDVSADRAVQICAEASFQIDSMPFTTADKAFAVSACIGLVELGPEMSSKDAVATADRACREAKAEQRGPVVAYRRNTDVFEERIAERRMMERMGDGFPFDRLFLEFQPIMSIREPFNSLNFEVLLRMHERDGATIPTGKLIAAAEKNGQMTHVDRWVLKNALEWISTNCVRLPKTQFICLNISGASLNDERFIEDAFAILAEFRAVVPKVCFEITESVALHDLKNTRRVIDRLKAFGARVALDDFGEGYTSFTYLKELPVDAIKIDGSFVKPINEHPANHAIVTAIVALARQLGMRTVAEWVENAGILQTLAEVGVDYAQGFAISRAIDGQRILRANSCGDLVADGGVIRALKEKNEEIERSLVMRRILQP